MDCTKDANLKHCICSYDPCSRKGRCCECLRYHMRSGELPGCLFSKKGERTYDRSVAAFAREASALGIPWRH